MECRRMGLAFALAAIVVASTHWHLGAVAQSSCTSAIISMSACLNYITGNSTTPSSSCCSQLANVVRSQPQCLCEVLNGGGASLGVTVNQSLALALPGACNVETPSISGCNASTPTNSPAGAPDSPPESGSNTGPSTDNGTSSDGSSTRFSFSLLFFLQLVALYASTTFVSNF